MTSRPLQTSLFGGAELARAKRRASDTPQGYAADPGTGPVGETCGTCASCTRRTSASGRTFIKCLLMRQRWTFSRASDILLASPACSHFSPAPKKPKKKRKPKARKSLPERLE